jgi:hypothetical protein
MHAPHLLNQILSIKYRIDTTKSEDCEPLFRELQSLMEQLQCVTKLNEERIKKMILLKYIQYAGSQELTLKDAPQQMHLTPQEKKV